MNPRSNACSTCRSRKVKCDRSLPTCSACRRLNLECVQQGAVPCLMWLEPGSPTRKSSRQEGDGELPEREMGLRRKPLFTDRDRIAECKRMSSRIPGQSIENILQQIDMQTEHHMEDNDTLELGPFGVFAIEVVTPLSESEPEEAVPTLPSLPEEIEEIWGCLGYNEQPPQQTQSIGAKSPFQVPWEGSSPNFLFGDGMEQIFALDADDNEEPQGITDLARFFSLSPRMSPRLPSPVPIIYPQDVGDMAPSVMRSLLDHYQYSMMSCFTPFHHAKPPWKILHLPCAVSAYGELALLGDSNNAKMTLLFAIFAMSAFNLSHLQTLTDDSQNWQSVAELYRDRAKARLKVCLQEQGAKEKKAKYKEVLMALLSMVTVCVVSGQMQEARCFLLDAERFIYLQSLRKHRKSRKVNMLHSIYLYLRIIEESTFTPVADTQPFLADYTCSVSETTPSTPCRYPSLWTDRLKVSSNLDSQSMVDLETRLVKFPIDADEPTMFEQIYGIPESLFRLVSHATHIADAVRRSRVTHPNGMPQELAQSAKLLESKICDWKNPYRLLAKVQTLVVYGPAESSNRIEIRTDLLFDFLEAMHSALIIYFYRRVRDMNAVALQHWVGRTINHLLEHERKKIKYGDTSAYVAWPGFIAACEALDPSHREQISAFLFRAGQSSGMRMFDAASDIASRVWAARDETGNIDVSWSDILATSKNGLVVT